MGASFPYLAFFDVDGTLISLRSLVSFLDFVRGRLDWDRQPWFQTYHARLGGMVHEGVDRSRLNAFYYTAFRGRAVREITQLGREWYESASRAAGFFHAQVVDQLHAHQREGAGIVLITGSFLPLLAPLAAALGVDDILCSRLQVANGAYTGALLGEPCIGAGKRTAAREHAAEHAVDLGLCHAYGDDESDRPLLEAVGFPHLLAAPPAYRGELERRDWTVGAGGEGT